MRVDQTLPYSQMHVQNLGSPTVEIGTQKLPAFGFCQLWNLIVNIFGRAYDIDN